MMSTVKPDLSIVVMPNTIPITNQVFTLFVTTEAYMHLKSLEPLSLACIMAMKRGLATPTPLPEDQFGIRGTRPVVVTVFPELYSEAMTVADLAFGGNIRLALGWAISAGSASVTSEDIRRYLQPNRQPRSQPSSPAQSPQETTITEAQPPRPKQVRRKFLRAASIITGPVPSHQEVTAMRVNLNLTQRQVAIQTSFARGSISDAETGRRSVPLVRFMLAQEYAKMQ
jgi:hypothetical protein